MGLHLVKLGEPPLLSNAVLTTARKTWKVEPLLSVDGTFELMVHPWHLDDIDNVGVERFYDPATGIPIVAEQQ